MNYKKAQKLAKTLVQFAMIFAVVSLFTPEDMMYLQMPVIVVAVCLLAFSYYILKKYCKCPYCGYDSIKKAFNRTVCPNCGRNIETGKKEKKVKKK